MALVSREETYASLLPDGAAASLERQLQACSPAVARELRWKARQPLRQLLMRHAELTVPGMTLHLVVRKRFMDDEARRAMADAVDRLLSSFREHAGPGSRLLFSFVDAEPGPIPLTGRFDSWSRLRLKMAAEPLRWSLPYERLDAFLELRGLRCVDCPDNQELDRRYLAQLPEASRRRREQSFPG
jgi:O-methyltransferase involved in polyketide biosynthesis